MGKKIYSFTTADNQKIIIDLEDENWKERWWHYVELRKTLGPPNNIDKDIPVKEAIPRLIELYDTRLLRIYNKDITLKRKNTLKKFLSSLERNVETNLKKMELAGAENPLLHPDYQEDIYKIRNEINKMRAKYSSNYSKDPLNAWIFDLYNILLITSQHKDTGKHLYKTRLQKYLSIRTNRSYTKLAQQKDDLLLEALEHVANPQMTIDHFETKYRIADFLCNFENCYSGYISKPRFHYEEDDEAGIRSSTEKVQRIIRDTYANNVKEQFLERLSIAYDKKSKKYYYK